MNVDVVIPALNEEQSIGAVVAKIPRPPARHVYVVDNGSVDATCERARAAGASVVHEPRRGYGAACMAGIAKLAADTDVVVFVDGDGADDPTLVPELIAPIVEDRADIVIGSRALGHAEPGSLSPQQRAGNAIAAGWLRMRFAQAATDLGPFRAIRASSLRSLGMRDPDYGWTIEMQLKAADRGLRYVEVPVPYFRRAGQSKISGTVRGVVGASVKIIGWLAYHDAQSTLSRWRSRVFGS